MDVLINIIFVIISGCVCISNNPIVQFKYIQFCKKKKRRKTKTRNKPPLAGNCKGGKISFPLHILGSLAGALEIKFVSLNLSSRLAREKNSLIMYTYMGLSQRNETQRSSQMIEAYIPS